MKALVIGDRFMTNEVLADHLRRALADLPVPLEIVFHQDEWPIQPLQLNDEVSEFCGDDAEIVPLVADADIVLTHTACITRRVIDAAGRLRVVGAARGGPVNINVAACTERGVPVVFAPGRNSGAVAEFTVGLILAATRSIAACHVSFHRDHRWRGDLYAFESLGDELSASTVGLVGLGAIGGKVARIMRAFGATVLACDPYLPETARAEVAAELVDLDEVLARSDIVSLHARYTPQTKGLISAERIGRMKSGAYLVNTSRGELVDHAALYAAMASGHLRGAALDVFEGEPPPDSSPLFGLDNIVTTTHIAGASRQAAYIGARVACEEIRTVVSGGTPRFLANREVLAMRSEA